MENQFKLKAPTIILSALALILNIISLVLYFVYSVYSGIYQVLFGVSDFISVSVFASLAICILFLVFVLLYQKHPKADILFPIMCVLIAVLPVIEDIQLLIVAPHIADSFTLTDMLDINVIFTLILIISFIILAIDSLKGLNHRVFLIIAISLGILASLPNLVESIREVRDYTDGHSFYGLISNCSSILLCTAILLFGLKNSLTLKDKSLTEEKTND